MIVKEEGVTALWKGITPRLMRIMPGQAITFMTYEFFRCAASDHREISTTRASAHDILIHTRYSSLDLPREGLSGLGPSLSNTPCALFLDLSLLCSKQITRFEGLPGFNLAMR